MSEDENYKARVIDWHFDEVFTSFTYYFIYCVLFALCYHYYIRRQNVVLDLERDFLDDIMDWILPREDPEYLVFDREAAADSSGESDDELEPDNNVEGPLPTNPRVKRTPG